MWNLHVFLIIALGLNCIGKNGKIKTYLENNIFDYIANKYKLLETTNSDQIIQETLSSYGKMLEKAYEYPFIRKYNFSVHKTYLEFLSEKRLFSLNMDAERTNDSSSIIFGRRRDRSYEFGGIVMVVPCVNNDLYFKTYDFMPNSFPTHFSKIRYMQYVDLGDELIEELMEIHNKYNKAFMISSTDNNNVLIFFDQKLVTYGSFKKMKKYVEDYCKALDCMLEVSNVIEKIKPPSN